MSESKKIVVLGLGYVGLPLACALSRTYSTTGFDLDATRIRELNNGTDRNHSTAASDLAHPGISFTNDPAAIHEADVVIVCVGTPVTEEHLPDLEPLKGAAKSVGEHLDRGSIVIFESTVYPGVTEDICAPILEKNSGLKLDRDFFIGYSPERISPGDDQHALRNVVKLIAARDDNTLSVMEEIYGSVTDAGVHRVSSIRVAEAAKVIENIQRDVNIALVNEFTILFHRMDIDTAEVLEAAGTKWNFGKYRPGLVGGHCIPVDPYYLSYAAAGVGYNPEIILAGRRTNNSMAEYVKEQILQLVGGSDDETSPKILVLGIAYKSNIPDTRSSLSLELIKLLKASNTKVDIYDPFFGNGDVPGFPGLHVLSELPASGEYDAVVLAVGHDDLKSRSAESFAALMSGNSNKKTFVDIVGIYDHDQFEPHNISYWRL